MTAFRTATASLLSSNTYNIHTAAQILILQIIR